MKNSIETLPRIIEYSGDLYSLNLYVTAWDKLCLSYIGWEKDEDGGRKNILSVVVEGPNKMRYNDQSDNIDCIADAVDLEDAVEITRTRINKFFKMTEKKWEERIED